MGWPELILMGVGLSMDAFAVAVCQGLGMKTVRWGRAATVGLYFGGFQALMPSLGWLLGSRFAGRIQRVDHWVAFFLLVLIGGKMLWEALTEPADVPAAGPAGHGQMLLLALATSVDALAVGITFAFLDTPILPAAGIIGATTFLISVAGVAVGCWFGARYKKGSEIAGGAILVLLGTKILLEHLELLP